MASNIINSPSVEASADGQVNNGILLKVSREIVTQWQELGRLLKMEDWQLDAIRLQHQSESPVEAAYRMLQKWTQANGTNATVSVLAEQLEEVGRRDIVHNIMTIPTTMKEEHSSEQAEWLTWLVSSLHDRYKNYIMKGLPWLDNIIRLADYYVNLSVQTGDRNDNTTQHVHEAFQSAFSANKHPVRILVEGPPGYGKTTLAAKLCFDHTTPEDYIKNFDVLLHISLRRFEGNLEEMFCSAAQLADSHDQERFLGILNNLSTRTLLVLDGFDEVPKQHVKPILDLLKGQRFRHVAVVVTSRPGHFTFETWERENDGCSKLSEVTVDWNRIWHSKIEILGIDDSLKEEFIVKHLENIPGEITEEVLLWVEEMKENDIIESKFLDCPLFLLLIILLATDEKTGGIHHLRTPTDLYKNVFNFIIHRYCSKQNEPVTETVDLFAVKKVDPFIAPKPFKANLLSQFIRTTIDLSRKFFSFIIHSFWTEQKVSTSKQVDLLTVGEAPTPVYVDLLCQFGEFALWALTEKKNSFSQEEILGSSPSRNPRILELGLLTQSVSKVGFREKILYEPVHKSLVEFSAAYALWLQFLESDRNSWANKVNHLFTCTRFESLCIIMLAGLMRDNFLDLLDTFKPCDDYVWKGWLRRSVKNIDLTESVLSSLTPFLPAHWGHDDEDCFSRTQHDALLLHGIRQGTIKQVTLTAFLATPMPDDLVVDIAKFSAIDDTVVNVHKFNCRHLVFRDSHDFHGLDTWIPSTINFQTISFEFLSDVSSDLRLLRSAITAEGVLKDVQISCKVKETADVEALTELLKMEKLKALILYGALSGSEAALNGLLRAAANSSQLTTLLLDEWSVDLCHLCGGVQKTWQFLNIIPNVKSYPQTDQTFQANCLVLNYHPFPAVFRFLEICCVTSLVCTPPLLVHFEALPLLPEYLTELNVLLNRTAEHCRLPHLPNLTALILTMTRDKPRAFDVMAFLFGSGSFLRLKGVELWEIYKNLELSFDIMNCVSACLEESIPVPTCQGTLRRSHSLQLEYFLMFSSGGDYFYFSARDEMSPHLTNKSLSRLDIVIPIGNSISETEFRVETGVWGTRSEDTILCRMRYDTYGSMFKCYSIRHTDN